MPITFVRPRLMRWNGNAVTDHNRQPLAVDVERIEKKQRMSNGTLRKYIVADKRSFSTSWNMLPKLSSKTVDGFWGGEDIEDFYNTVTGSFSLEISDADGTTNTYNVMFSDYSKTITKRGSVDYWEISVSMEEV